MKTGKGKTPRLFAAFFAALFIIVIIGVVDLVHPAGVLAQEAGDGQPAFAVDGRELVAAIPQNFPPYYHLDKQGRPGGFAIEVFDNIAVIAGYRVSYRVEQTWPDVFDALRTGRADVIPDLGITPDRLEWADFTRPVETFAIAIFVRKSTQDITGMENLSGHDVATVAGNVGVKLLDEHPDIQRVVYARPELALFALLSAEVDALVYPAPAVWKLAAAARVDDRIRRVGKPLLEVKRAIAVHKGDIELQQRLDRAAQAFLASEAYRDIYKRWFGTPQPFWTVARVAYLAAGIVTVALVVLVVLMSVWRNRALHRLNRALEGQVAERTQAIRHHAALLESANKDMEAFAYSVSHDLRAPLRAISGFSNILLEDYQGRLDAEGQRLLHVVDDNAQRMGQLIDDILAFSRAGRLELHLENVDMNRLVKEAWADLSTEIGERRVELLVGDLPEVHADSAALRQVLVNLLSNALKFSATRDPARIEIGANTEGDEIILFVRDNGVGFNMDYVGKLFGVFQRLHGAEYEGTGIGLSIIKRIIDKHAGRVWAEAEEGKGATFYFALPRKLGRD